MLPLLGGLLPLCCWSKEEWKLWRRLSDDVDKGSLWLERLVRLRVWGGGWIEVLLVVFGSINGESGMVARMAWGLGLVERWDRMDLEVCVRTCVECAVK